MYLKYLLSGLLVTTAIVFFSMVSYDPLRDANALKIAGAKAQLEAFAIAIKDYTAHTGSPLDSESGLKSLIVRPATAMGWNGPYLSRAAIPNDPWGHAYVYLSGANAQLISYGADGVAGGTGANADIIVRLGDKLR